MRLIFNGSRKPGSWTPGLAIGLTLLLAVAGCIKKDESEASSASAAEQTKVFRYYRTAEYKTLDPMKQFDAASAEIIINVYDTLLEYHYLKRPYQLVPGLLAKMPEKQKDGVTYHFTLKKGVRFHDDEAFPQGKGREVKADDIIYTIKRFADANVNSLSYVLLAGFVEGLDEFREQTKKLGEEKTDYDKLEVSGLKKLDDYTVAIKFTRDNPLALYPFAFSGMSIIPREAVEKYGRDFAEHPVGTGPFIPKELSRRGELVLVKNPDYHQVYPETGAPGDEEAGLLVDKGKKLPLVDEVRLPLIEESQPAMLKFLNGELDWIGMNKDDFTRMAYRDDKGQFHLQKEYADKFYMYTEPGLYSGYFAFNLDDKLVGKNKALRQAIAYALDAEKWIELLRNGRGMKLNSIVPHPIAGSEEDVETDYYTQNLEMAKKKLAEAGYPEGKGLPEITMDFRSTTKDSRQDFEFVRNELAKIGIRLKGNFQTFSAYLKKVESGNFQLVSSAWGADYPDAENFYQLLYSPNKSPGPNHSAYNNPEYDKLYEQIKYMPNGPERYAIFKKMNAIIKEDVPIILRWNTLAFGLYQKRVGNMKRNMMIDNPYKHLNVDRDQKVSH